jgi:hypothetical protein
MSSLQKFHRRTNNISSGPAPFPYSPIGNGNTTVGYWLGTAGDGVSKLIVAPVSTEASKIWRVDGAYIVDTGATSLTDGVTNTNTLYSLGTKDPAAYYCKTLTTGGYNTWYLPASQECQTLITCKNATPFATANGFLVNTGGYLWSSTNNNSSVTYTFRVAIDSNQVGVLHGKYAQKTRAVRRSG